MTRPRRALSLPLVAATLALGGCADTPCPDDLPPIVAGCAVPTAGWDGADPMDGTGVSVAFGATVDEVGTGTPPAGCFEAGTHPGGNTPGDASWARVTEAGTDVEWIVGFVAPSADTVPLPAVGESLQVAYDFRFGGFSPDVGQLTLRDSAGELLVWVGASGGVDDIQSPTELAISKGEARCSEADVCGDWQQYHLAVAVDGQPADGGLPVQYGESVAIDALTFVHAGYAESTRTSPNCADWFVADLDAALLRSPAR